MPASLNKLRHAPRNSGKILTRPLKSSYCIWLFVCFFSNECRATSNVMSLKDILLSALDMTTFAQRQSEACFPEMHIFQNGTQCKSQTCFRMARVITAPCGYSDDTLMTSGPPGSNRRESLLLMFLVHYCAFLKLL